MKDKSFTRKFVLAAQMLQVAGKNGDNMKVLDTKFVKGFIKMADDGFSQGWHERNGGNLTYRIKVEEIESIRNRTG